jgi:hypothetical protein
LLTSETWHRIRNGVKQLVSELEVKGKQVAAARIDREYAQLAESLRYAVKQNNPPKIKDDFVLWDISQEFLCTLRSLCRFQADINRQFSQTNHSQSATAASSDLLTASAISEIVNTAILKLADQPNIRIKKSKLPESVRRPGPERVSIGEAKRRIKLLQDWADLQDKNKDRSGHTVSLEQFAKSVSNTATGIKKYQAWYRKYHTHGDFPHDPRQVDPRKLAELFE